MAKLTIRRLVPKLLDDRELEPAAWSTREMERLYRRGIWLAHLLCEADLEPELERIAHTGRDASPLAEYKKERKLFASHPHLAMYWLLAFGVLVADELEDALEASKKVKHPAVRAVHAHLTAGKDLLAHRKKTWPVKERDAVLAKVREEIL
jgi:hypothetical protein